jgi:hypothetical protein
MNEITSISREYKITRDDINECFNLSVKVKFTYDYITDKIYGDYTSFTDNETYKTARERLGHIANDIERDVMRIQEQEQEQQ